MANSLFIRSLTRASADDRFSPPAAVAGPGRPQPLRHSAGPRAQPRPHDGSGPVCQAVVGTAWRSPTARCRTAARSHQAFSPSVALRSRWSGQSGLRSAPSQSEATSTMGRGSRQLRQRPVENTVTATVPACPGRRTISENFQLGACTGGNASLCRRFEAKTRSVEPPDRRRDNAGSRGVTWATEDPRSMPLSEHSGYRRVGDQQGGRALRTSGCLPAAFGDAARTPLTTASERR